jgi:prepilin-type N-terminal cleavage/methylation domain-containing protein
MLARMRAWRRSDAGLTLTEMLVSMMIMGILIAAVATLYLGSLRSSTGTRARLEEVNDGRIAVSAMTRSLRTAILPSQLYDAAAVDQAAFIEASPFEMRFYANIDNPDNTIGPTRVTYTVNANGDLMETKQRPNQPIVDNRFIYCDPASPTCAVDQRVLARGVDPAASIFTYYDALGLPFPAAELTQEQMENIDAVDIVLTVEQAGSGGNGSTYVSRIALPNHDAVIRSQDGEE